MLDREIEDIKDVVIRFCAQVRKLDGVSTRVTAALTHTQVGQRPLRRLLHDVYSGAGVGLDTTFVRNCHAMWRSGHGCEDLNAMLEVYVANGPNITLGDMLIEAYNEVERRATLVEESKYVDVTRSTDTQPRIIDRLDAMLLSMDKIPTDELIKELQRRSTYSVVLFDEGDEDRYNWHGDARIVIGCMEVMKAAMLRPVPVEED